MTSLLSLPRDLLREIALHLTPDWTDYGDKSLADLAHFTALCATTYAIGVDLLWARPTWGVADLPEERLSFWRSGRERDDFRPQEEDRRIVPYEWQNIRFSLRGYIRQVTFEGYDDEALRAAQAECRQMLPDIHVACLNRRNVSLEVYVADTPDPYIVSYLGPAQEWLDSILLDISHKGKVDVALEWGLITTAKVTLRLRVRFGDTAVADAAAWLPLINHLHGEVADFDEPYTGFVWTIPQWWNAQGIVHQLADQVERIRRDPNATD